MGKVGHDGRRWDGRATFPRHSLWLKRGDLQVVPESGRNDDPLAYSKWTAQNTGLRLVIQTASSVVAQVNGEKCRRNAINTISLPCINKEGRFATQNGDRQLVTRAESMLTDKSAVKVGRFYRVRWLSLWAHIAPFLFRIPNTSWNYW